MNIFMTPKTLLMFPQFDKCRDDQGSVNQSSKLFWNPSLIPNHIIKYIKIFFYENNRGKQKVEMEGVEELARKV